MQFFQFFAHREQFHIFLTKSYADKEEKVGEELINSIDNLTIRSYLGALHRKALNKTSIARKLTCLRSFFKFCVPDI